MIPKFSALDFVSFYIELPVIAVMYVAWLFPWHTSRTSRTAGLSDSATTPLLSPPSFSEPEVPYNDLVDIHTVDLFRDEYIEEEITGKDDERERGNGRYFWKLFYDWVV